MSIPHISAEFCDLVREEDPEFHASEELAVAIETMLEQTRHHDVVRIDALATLVVAYLRNAPSRYRIAMTDSLLDSIRSEVVGLS